MRVGSPQPHHMLKKQPPPVAVCGISQNKWKQSKDGGDGRKSSIFILGVSGSAVFAANRLAVALHRATHTVSRQEGGAAEYQVMMLAEAEICGGYSLCASGPACSCRYCMSLLCSCMLSFCRVLSLCLRAASRLRMRSMCFSTRLVCNHTRVQGLTCLTERRSKAANQGIKKFHKLPSPA